MILLENISFPFSVIKGMAEDESHDGRSSGILNPVYRELFDDKGVLGIISEGRLYINGSPLPRSGSEFEEAYPAGLCINEEPWLILSGGKWEIKQGGPAGVGKGPAGPEKNKPAGGPGLPGAGRKPEGNRPGFGPMGGPKVFSCYEEAVLSMLKEKVVDGLEFVLFDDNGDSICDRIELFVYETVQANRIIRNGDGSYTIEQGDWSRDIEYPERFRKFVSGGRDFPRGTNIPADCFDSTIDAECECAYYMAPDGRWRFVRCVEKKGVFNEGTDHRYYMVDGIKYPDAMKYPRNMLPSNRCGGYSNIMNYFGFKNRPEYEVSLWLSPMSEYARTFTAPIGFTSWSSSSEFLRQAIALGEEKLGRTSPSLDGNDVEKGRLWVRPDIYKELQDAVKMAKDTLAVEKRSAFLDFMSYMIFVTLAGTKDDISASFMGYDFEGFDNLVSAYRVLPSALCGDADAEAVYEKGGFVINGFTFKKGETLRANGAETDLTPAEYIKSAAGREGCRVDYMALCGETEITRIEIKDCLAGTVEKTAGNFKSIKLFDKSGNVFTDAAGAEIEVLKVYTPGFSDREDGLNRRVYYRFDARYRGGEWVVE